MSWHAFEAGATVGTPGTEGGITLLDDEHDGGARMTLERCGAIAPHAITCGIYGVMVHTRYFSEEGPARTQYDIMKIALETLLDLWPDADEPPDDLERDAKKDRFYAAVSQFVEEYPS